MKTQMTNIARIHCMKSFWKTFVLILFAWVGGLTASFAQNQSNDNVYAVGTGENCDLRMKVVFHQASGATTEIYVTEQDKNASDAVFNQVLYDPGYGTLPSGVSFYGWTTTEDYSEIQINTSKTIDEVRTDVKNNFTAGTTRDYYALLFKHHTVTFIDEPARIYPIR